MKELALQNYSVSDFFLGRKPFGIPLTPGDSKQHEPAWDEEHDKGPLVEQPELILLKICIGSAGDVNGEAKAAPPRARTKAAPIILTRESNLERFEIGGNLPYG